MTDHWTHRTIATALLAFLIVTGWKVSAILASLESWQAWDQPKIAGDLVQAMVFGLVALGLALGLNFSAFVRGLGVPMGDKEP